MPVKLAVSAFRSAGWIVFGLGAALVTHKRAAAGTIAFDRPDLQASTPLQVAIAGVTPGGPLPTNYTSDGRNLSPPISWTAGPPATRSYVVVMQDPDASKPDAALHWLVYGLSPGVLGLSRGLHNVASLASPLGAAQGRNDHDSFGYSGPRPPPTAPLHHYHLQVFALDRPVRVRPGGDLSAVERAMAGHVIARGELVTTYVTPPPKIPPGARPTQNAPPTSGA